MSATPTGRPVLPAAEDAWRLLRLAARLLLEYNERAETIDRQLRRLSRHVGLDAEARVTYRHVELWSRERDLHVQVPELRINAAVSSAALQTIGALCDGDIDTGEAVRRLEVVEHTAPRQPRGLVVLAFGLAAAAIAWLLHADAGAIVTSGLSASLGLLARQTLTKWHVAIVVPPFVAALIGAVIGGLAIRAGATLTPSLCLVVPALMLVPGPHLINSLDDLMDNHVMASLCRLWLAGGILVAAALGVLLGRALVLGTAMQVTPSTDGMATTLLLDMLLAGLAAWGFGAFYNAPRHVLWISIACGMVGHGLRYVLVAEDSSLEIATLVGCIAVGLMAAVAADRRHLPFGAVAFAGAVPMMPGVFIYGSIAGAAQLSAAGANADPALVATTAGLFCKAAFVVLAMAIGLVIGARLADPLLRRAGGRAVRT